MTVLCFSTQQEILEHEDREDGTYFLTKWLGYEDPTDLTWEPLSHFKDKSVVLQYLLDIDRRNRENKAAAAEVHGHGPEDEYDDMEGDDNNDYEGEEDEEDDYEDEDEGEDDYEDDVDEDEDDAADEEEADDSDESEEEEEEDEEEDWNNGHDDSDDYM